ncbi:6-bladed beta-propeller [Rhodohalobacter sulfatireducens]|nr:6-bladed beta-propeller [Rhodohalobacter sulfatireducens]
MMVYIGLTYFFLSLLVSCSFEIPSNKEQDDPYTNNLLKNLTEKSITQNIISLPEDIVQPVMIEILNNRKSIIIADNAKKKLFFLDEDGEILSVTGRSGRGPGEFELITGTHIGNDDHMYVHDAILKRITVYAVENNELRLLDTIVYETPESHTLYNIFINKQGIYGLYNESEGFHTPENRYILYQLDKNFKPIEQKLTFPGEIRKVRNTGDFLLYGPHDYSNDYLWSHNDNMFYYTNNYEALIKGYPFQTEEDIVIYETNLPVRPNNDYYLATADSAYNFDSNKDYWAYLENLETLPVLSGIWTDNTHIILSIRPAPGDDIVMLWLHQEKNGMSYFMLPAETGVTRYKENILYSIVEEKDGKHYLIKTMFES